MENQTASVKKIGLNYGLLLGLLSVALSVITYVLGVHMERPWWVSLLSFLIMLGVIVYGLKSFKKDNAGFLSLGEAIKVGLAISLISAIIAAIFNYIFVTVIEPNFVNDMLVMTQENMIKQNPNMTEEQMEMGMSMTEKFMQPWIMSTMIIIMSLFFGFIISLITGLIMKQPRPTHE